MEKKPQRYIHVLQAALAGFSVSFLYVYLINRYPFFWSDSETYIGYAIKDVVTTYGTTAYPKFLQAFLGQYSLWYPLFTQMIIAAYVLWHFCKHLFPRFSVLQFFTLNILLVPTSYHFYINTIMPDIFLPLGMLCYYLILQKNLSIKHALLYLIFCFCVIAHNGFPYIFILFSALTLPVFVLKSKNATSLKKSTFITILILLSAFVFKPLLALTYEKDIRKKRNVNFFCRQIILTQYDKLFAETLQIGCSDIESEVCDLTVSRKNIIKLKYRNKWDDECKQIFFTALKDKGYRSALFRSKINNLFKMLPNLSAYRNAGSNPKQHKDITKIIKSDPFLSMTQSKVNQSNLSFRAIMKSKSSFVKNYFNICLAGLLMLSLLKLFQLAKFNIIKIDNGIISFFIFCLAFIFVSIVFYGLFSRPGNSRYAMRLGWLIPLCFLVFIFSFYNDYGIGKDEET